MTLHCRLALALPIPATLFILLDRKRSPSLDI
jgi:hypothetical protein